MFFLFVRFLCLSEAKTGTLAENRLHSVFFCPGNNDYSKDIPCANPTCSGPTFEKKIQFLMWYGFCVKCFPVPLNRPKSVTPCVSLTAAKAFCLMSNTCSISRDLLLILPLITCSASSVSEEVPLLSWLTVLGQKSMTKSHQQLFSLCH